MAATRISKFLRRSFGYGSIFSFAFSLTLYWSFPYALIGERLLGDVRAESGLEIEVGELRPHWLTGLKATDVTIKTRPRRKSDEPFELLLSELTVSLHVLDSLFGHPTVGFNAVTELGSVSGVVQKLEDDRVALELELDAVEIGKIPRIWDELGIGFQGTASGDADITLPQGSPLKFDGTVDLMLSQAKFGGGMIKGFTVPTVELGDVPIRFTSEAGRVSFDPPLTIKSVDLDAKISGVIELKSAFATSNADLLLKFKPTDKFWKDNSKLSGIAQGLLKNSQASDGFYTYELKGRLGRPNFRAKR